MSGLSGIHAGTLLGCDDCLDDSCSTVLQMIQVKETGLSPCLKTAVTLACCQSRGTWPVLYDCWKMMPLVLGWAPNHFV